MTDAATALKADKLPRRVNQVRVETWEGIGMLKVPGFAIFTGDALFALLLFSLVHGCSDFAERSCRMAPDNVVRLSSYAAQNTDSPSTRHWLQVAHHQLSPSLPQNSKPSLLTEQLVSPAGEPVDVFAHFRINPAGLQSLIANTRGLKYSAQAASRQYFIERQAPSWPGFEDIWIPIRLPNGGDLSLSGRLGYARDPQGNIKTATCLVILPGLFGDHGVQRSQDLARPLRQAGFHVLSLELRGHGQTERRYPQMRHTFGAFEMDDLMQVSDWLEKQPYVDCTGIIGCCWNANIALLAAWYDGSSPQDPLIPSTLRRNLLAHDPQKRRFAAGIVALSPVVRGEELIDQLDRDRSLWKHPIYAAIQDTIRDRMLKKGYPVTGSLRQLMDNEYAAYSISSTHSFRELYPLLRLIAYGQEPAGDKLESARMPVLIVHGADDPLIPAQDIADLMAGVDNKGVAALILPSGGHVGFAGYAPKYYLSLIVNFFDPVRGAAASPRPARADRCTDGTLHDAE